MSRIVASLLVVLVLAGCAFQPPPGLFAHDVGFVGAPRVHKVLAAPGLSDLVNIEGVVEIRTHREPQAFHMVLQMQIGTRTSIKQADGSYVRHFTWRNIGYPSNIYEPPPVGESASYTKTVGCKTKFFRLKVTADGRSSRGKPHSDGPFYSHHLRVATCHAGASR